MPTPDPTPEPRHGSDASTDKAHAFCRSRREDLLDQTSITEKKMFGTTALCVGGKVFMFPWRDQLVVKVPAPLANELVTAAQAELFDPGHGRTSPTWVAVFASASHRWAELADQAQTFVKG
ncbi:TfoX/Sxy family protein [Streptomyces puniciscabiei]